MGFCFLASIQTAVWSGQQYRQTSVIPFCLFFTKQDRQNALCADRNPPSVRSSFCMWPSVGDQTAFLSAAVQIFFRISLQNTDEQARFSDSRLTDSRSLQNGAKEFLPPSQYFSTVWNTILYRKSPRDASSCCVPAVSMYWTQHFTQLSSLMTDWHNFSVLPVRTFTALLHVSAKLYCHRQVVYISVQRKCALGRGLSCCKLWICCCKTELLFQME